MLKFNRSRDGQMRTTVRVDFRIDITAVAYAVALDSYRETMPDGYVDEDDDSWIEEAKEVVQKYTKARAEESTRNFMVAFGPVPQWPEEHSDEFSEVVELAEAHVKTLWPEAANV